MGQYLLYGKNNLAKKYQYGEMKQQELERQIQKLDQLVNIGLERWKKKQKKMRHWTKK